MVIINPVPLPPFGGQPYSNITPFTYRDGWTFQRVLEELRKYIRDVVAPHIDESFEQLEDYVDAAVATLTVYVQTQIAENQEWTQEQIDALTLYVNNIVQQIIDNSIEVQDPVVAQLLRDADSETSIEVRKTTIPAGTGLYSIDNYAGADDAAKLQAAIDAATDANEERVIVITRPITLDRMVTVDIGRVSLDFRGGTVNTAPILSGPALHITNRMTVAESVAQGTANNRKFINGLRLHGAGTSTEVSPNTIGILFRSEPGFGPVRGVNISDCEFRGYGTIERFETNSYLIRHYNCHYYYYLTGAVQALDQTNYGESISFTSCGFGTGGTALHNQNSDGEFTVQGGTSFDFCQVVANAERGMINIFQPHIELNSAVSPLTSGPIIVTGTQSASVTIYGGKMMFHTPPTMEHLFETNNVYWGGGIFLSGGMETYQMQCASNILCGGTGRIYTSNIYGLDGNASGAGGGSIITSRYNNLLIDGTFQHTTTPVDATLTHAGATSRLVSPTTVLSIDTGNLRVEKLNAGGNSGLISVYIPVEHMERKEYAGGFAVTGTVSGTFSAGEAFVALGPRDARGIPEVLRRDARSSSTVTLVGGLESSRYYASTTFDRTVRPWATHFELNFNVNAYPAGALLFREIIVSSR